MTGTHELRVERVIAAPVAAVWAAWVGHREEWFCPQPWRVEIHHDELRAGGGSTMTMHGPAGEAMPMTGIYLAVELERRIVSTDAVTPDWQPQGPFMVRIDMFDELGDGRTRYVAIARHWTAEAKAEHAAMGFAEGWGAAAAQLEAVARRLAA